jgi:uncharacterized RDD family membrane protein YckC
MPDEPTGPTGGGPPSYPGNVSPPPFPPPPPAAPPSYPLPPPPGSYPGGGYPPPQGQYPRPDGFGGPGPGGAPYATWGTRLGGYLIDVVIFIPVFVILAILFRHTNVLSVHFNMRNNGTQQRRTFSLLSVVLTGVADLVYVTVLCGGRRGQTVGMMAVGIRVVQDATYDVVGYGRALGRGLVEQVFRLLGSATFILGVVWLLDMLFPLWDKKRQTLHDKIAKTVVLRVRNVA